MTRRAGELVWRASAKPDASGVAERSARPLPERFTDLPGQTLKFRVDPQLVASLEGQGGKTDLQGLGVPIMIAGPWATPSIYPDIEGILNDPAAAYEQLNRLGGGSFLCLVPETPAAFPPSAP